jgi:hypothetical protein
MANERKPFDEELAAFLAWVMQHRDLELVSLFSTGEVETTPDPEQIAEYARDWMAGKPPAPLTGEE